MKLSRTVLGLALTVGVAVPALAVAAPTATAPAAPVVVTHYTFDGGATATGVIAENSGRGLPLRVRSANGAALQFGTRQPGRYVAFPARCAPAPDAAATCPRAIMEGGNDADLNPGSAPFRFGATVHATAAQVGAEANVVQKGVATTASQWKLQIGGGRARAQCVLVGRGSTRAYVAKSDITVADGRWHRILCRRAGTALLVYVDGVVRGRTTVPASLSIGNTMPLRIGGRALNGLTDLYGGNLDDVLVVRG